VRVYLEGTVSCSRPAAAALFVLKKVVDTCNLPLSSRLYANSAASLLHYLSSSISILYMEVEMRTSDRYPNCDFVSGSCSVDFRQAF
jgi:hypothetical protein